MNKEQLYFAPFRTAPKAFTIFYYALCISLLYLFMAPKEYDFITGDYYSQLSSILQGYGLKTAGGIILDRYPPIIPYLFSAFFTLSKIFHAAPQIFYIIYSAIAISTATVFVYKIATLLLSHHVGILASLLFASCPFIQFGIIRVASEPTYIMLLYAAAYLLINIYIQYRYRLLSFIVIGALLGLAMLTRPAGILFPILFALFILFAFPVPFIKRLLFAFVLLFSSLLTIAPWEYAISRQEGYLVPLSTGGPISIWDGLRFNNCNHRAHLSLSPAAQQLSDTVANHLHDFKSNTVPFLKEQFHRAPSAFLELIGLKVLRSWYAVESQNKHLEVFSIILISIYLILAFIGASSYLKKDGKQTMAILAFFLSIIFYSWAMTTIVLSILRYISPVLGFIFIFSAQGIYAIWPKNTAHLPNRN